MYEGEQRIAALQKKGTAKTCAEAFGPVVLDETEAHYLWATAHTNNTGELTALAKALTVALKKFEGHPATICYDSEYAANMTQGTWMPKENQGLIKCCRELCELLQAKQDITWQWIKAHSDTIGNDKADELANKGADGEVK